MPFGTNVDMDVDLDFWPAALSEDPQFERGGGAMSATPSCSTLAPDEIDRVFFDENHRREAVAICAGCPVQTACATYADTHRVPHGVWGGESGAARRRRLGIPLYPIAAA